MGGFIMKNLIVALAIVFVFCGLAHAAEVTLTWNPVDFAVCGSDPAKSGYKVYKSTDEGATKILSGSVDSTALTFTYIETGNAKLCYFATAYNQFGESGYSEPACVYVSNVPPAAPTGLDAVIKILEQISQTLQTIAGKM
jgi:hypothetical protein